MRVMKCWVMLMALACVPLLSHAAEVKLTSSTQYLWYQDILADQGEIGHAVTASSTPTYPFCSSSSAKSLSPDLTIRPSANTCTRSGTM